LSTSNVTLGLRASAAPAASIAVAAEFELTHSETWGVRDADTETPAGAGTLFQAGSISKPVTALTALALVRQGALDLSEVVPLPGGRGTLKQLLSHSAGVNVESFPGYPAGLPMPSPAESRDGRPPAVTSPVRVDGAHGRFRYSGGGYLLVQGLIEDATGGPFAELARELVLEPLAMHDSTFEALPAEGASGHRDGIPVEGGRHVYP
jgi:CubicO group peptidase (beta-lactamase class C family)